MALKPGLVAVALAVGVLLFVSANENVAQAAHYELVVSNPEFNPAGGTSSPSLWGVRPSWVMDGQSLKVCSEWGSNYLEIPLGIRQAIADWEQVLPGTQLSQSCGASGEKLWLMRRSVSPGLFPLWCGAGCVPYEYSYDSLREAYYPNDLPVIWFDDVDWTYTDNGWQALAGHELGHIFGLDEYYIEADPEADPPSEIECNPDGSSSVMNALAPPSGNQITGPCANGSVSPTQGDIDLVESFYYADPPDEFDLTLLSSDTLDVDFLDREWAESGYRFYAEVWNGGSWVYTGENWLTSAGVGNKNYWNETTYNKDGSLPPGNYHICVTGLTEIYGPTGWECSPSVHMADHDPAAESVNTLGPAAINLSATDPRTMWLIAEFSNQGDHVENIEFSLNLYVPPPSGCSRTPHLILPGIESRLLLPGETKWAVYRVLYECHAPAGPPGVYQPVTFSVSHPGGGEPLDAQDNNSASSNKFLIIQ